MTNKKRFLISVASIQLLTLSLGALAVAGDEGLPEILSQLSQAQKTMDKYSANPNSSEYQKAKKLKVDLIYGKLMTGSWDNALVKEYVTLNTAWNKDTGNTAAKDKSQKAYRAMLGSEAPTAVVQNQIASEARPTYLSSDKIATTFKYFSVKKSDASAQINGTVFKDCADKFRFIPVSEKSAGNGEYVGYQIIDQGGGLACVEEANKAFSACGTSLNLTKECSFDYVELKTLPGTSLQLPGSGSALIGLQTLDGSKPSDMLNFADFPGGQIAYTSPAQRKLDAYNTQVAGWDNDYRNCRSSLDELDIARVSLGSLVNIGQGPSNVETALKILNVDQKAVYEKMILKAKTKEELASLRETILAWAAEGPVGLSGDDFATLMQTIAGRYANDPALGAERFKLADATITEAEGIAGLSSERQAGLQNNHTEIGVTRMTSLAEDGYYGNTALASYLGSKDYRDFTKQLSKYMNQACGNKGSLDSCVAARSAASNVMQVQSNLQQNFYNPQASPQAQMMAQVAQHQNAVPTFGASYGSTPQQNAFNPLANSFTPMGTGNMGAWLGGTYGNTGNTASAYPTIRSNFGS